MVLLMGLLKRAGASARRIASGVPTGSGQNLVEKLAQRYAIDLPRDHVVRAGDTLSLSPHSVITRDSSSAVMNRFRRLGAAQFANCRAVIALDPDTPDFGTKNGAIGRFAQDHGVDYVVHRRGVGENRLVEDGYAFPQTLVAASGDEANTYGAVGCLGAKIGRSEAAGLWATGRMWWEVPPVARVVLYNRPRLGVTGRDIIIALRALFDRGDVRHHCVEFAGDGLASLSMQDRVTIADMTTEWNALTGLFPVDRVTLGWLRERVNANRLSGDAISELASSLLAPDSDAVYHKLLSLDLASVQPHVAGPGRIEPVARLAQQRVRIDKAYIVPTAADDLEHAAAALRGRKVAPGVRLYVAPADGDAQARAEAAGHWQAILDAGATPLAPANRLVKDGEVGISTAPPRALSVPACELAGAPEYIASAAVVAASAVAGHICAPPQVPTDDVPPIGSVIVPPRPLAKPTDEDAPIIDGFERRASGPLVYFETPAQAVATLPDLPASEIPVFGFDVGEARDVAELLRSRSGVAFARSASAMYKRSALNKSGLLVLAAPDLAVQCSAVLDAESAPGGVPTGWTAEVDFAKTSVAVNERAGRQWHFAIRPVGTSAQEIAVAGGLQPWLVNRIKAAAAADEEERATAATA